MTELFDRTTGEILEPEDSVTVAFAIYMQEAARQEHWVKHRKLIKPWRISIKERMGEFDGLPSWREAIGIASRSEFLTGKIIGTRGRFKLDLNFILQPKTFAKILDNFYTRDDGPTTKKLTLPSMQPPHLKPQPAFVPEPLEVREQAMIDSYRKYGRYADANRIEQKRADRLGVPAVLVPAPDVAFTSGKPEGHQDRRRERSERANPITGVTEAEPPWVNEDVPESAYGED